METIEDMNGKEIKVSVIEGREPNEYSLTIDFDGQSSMSTKGYMEGGDFTLYSMTPKAMASLAWAIIEAAAKAKAARELDLVEQPIKSGNTGEAISVGGYPLCGQ